MAVRTLQLGEARGNIPPAAITVYTCPAGKTAIIKDVQVQNGTATTSFLLILRGGVQYPVVKHVTTTALVAASFVRWTVMEPGDVLQALWLSNDASNVMWVSGAELDGVVA